LLAIGRAQFETIHPYLVGGGQAGRLLRLPRLLRAAEGYPPLQLSGELLAQRRVYLAALAAMRLGAKPNIPF
jgi:hypothetical protein